MQPESGPPVGRAGDPDNTAGEIPDRGSVHEFTHSGEPQRLDAILCERVPGHSRAFFQRLIDEGCVTVTPPARREIKASMRLPPGSRIRLVIPPPRKLDLSPRDIPLEILYEDAYFAVIDKPAGLAVHPSPHQDTETLVQALLYRLKDLSSIGGEERPGIVHRLDKETSGVLVIAKNDRTHNAISSQFKSRQVHKTYLAVVRGEPGEEEGRISLPLGKSYSNPKRQAIRMDGTGREAVTDYRVLERYRGYSLLEIWPHTGRTHQIRVHLAHLGTPVACDKLYGREKTIYLSTLRERPRTADEPQIMARQALHATAITFRHPHSGETVSFTAKLHADMRELLGALSTYRAYR